MTERYYRPDRTVFVDMDGVLADFDAEAIRRVKAVRPGFEANLPRAHFYLADDYPGYDEEIRVACAEEGFFEDLPVISNAIGGWQSIIDAGFTPRVLSSPLRSNATSERDKRRWLMKHFAPLFGEHVANDAIITKDKHLHDGVALLDDRPEVPHADGARWSHVLITYPHNAMISTDLRINDLGDSRLEEVLNLAVQRYPRGLGAAALL